MPIYDVDARLVLTGMEVEADSEEEAEQIVTEALEDLVADYVPLDASGSRVDIIGLMDLDEESYSVKPLRDGKGRFVSGNGGAPASKSGKGKTAPRSKACKGKPPANKTKGVRR